LAVAAAAALLAACSNAPVLLPPAERPLSKESLMLLGKKGMDPNAPIFIRVFKEESELEVWKARDDGVFFHYKTYPICHWSGDLGPKIRQGDKQAPEGFYNVSKAQMNPHSQFYLAFNLGYPNAYDRAHKRDGNFLMVHGKCKSAGCYAMTDSLMEEIFALARESFKGGQTSFPVHAFPFRMTDANMERHKGHQWTPFWRTLKEAYDHFEIYRVPPAIAVCEKRYVVNAVLPDGTGRIDAEGRCPALERPQLTAFVPKPNELQLAQERIVMPGPKTRVAAGTGAMQADAPTETASTSGSSGLGLGAVGKLFGLGGVASKPPGSGVGYSTQ
jgi:murein L,D-transpeptidase YafK